MPTKRDYYEILGITRQATSDEITRAYRKLVMQYHPDRNGGDKEAETRFKEVAEAHEVLRDPEKRQRYDRHGHAGLEGMAMPDFGGDVMSMFGSFFDSFFGGGGAGGRSRTPKGQDAEADIELDLAEAATGVTRSIPVRRADTCRRCKGSGATEKTQKKKCRTCEGRGVVLQGAGFISIQRDCPACYGQGYTLSDPCPECRGNGHTVADCKIEVQVPPGVDSNNILPVRGEGHSGGPNIPRGDLMVRIRVRKHPLFERNGDDLICQAVINFPQAALGCEIEIPTVSGKLIRQQLPAGVQSHEVLTLPGQGMPNVRGGKRGSLHVQILVETPRHLNRRQEELLRELAEIDETNVSPQRKSWLDKIKDFFTESTKG